MAMGLCEPSSLLWQEITYPMSLIAIQFVQMMTQQGGPYDMQPFQVSLELEIVFLIR